MTAKQKEKSREPYTPSGSDLETAREIVKRCGLRDGLFKGLRTLNAVETVAYALLDARRGRDVEQNNWQYTHERDAELINSDLFMCEAHPGLDFGHDPDCAGPGMAWIIEGRAAIEALLSSRDAEIREVLEGLSAQTTETTRCWCLNDGTLHHTPACLAARALYDKLNSTTENNDPNLQE